MQYTTQQLERFIRAYLTLHREKHPFAAVSTLVLFNSVETHMVGTTAAQFNKTVGDLKRTGIVGTAKGGEALFLTDAAWNMHQALLRMNADTKTEAATSTSDDKAGQ